MNSLSQFWKAIHNIIFWKKKEELNAFSKKWFFKYNGD